MAARPVTIAVTGGIGAGKSELLKAFARHGAAVVSSDEIVHRLLREDDEVREALIGRFGRGIVRSDGDIDRSAVAERVFRERADLEWLEALLHPRVSREYLRWREQLADLPNPPTLCVTEVPLLYEVGADERFDVVVALTASPRIRARRGRPVPEERAERQLPDEHKLQRADYSYVNNRSLEELDAFIATVMSELQHRATKMT